MNVQFSIKKEMGPKYLIYIAFLGIILFFILGLKNSIMFYKMLPKDENADILVFYQNACPHCINEIPKIKELINRGYKVSAFNVFEYVNLSNKYEIKVTPTIIIPKNNAKIEGEASIENIIKVIKEEKNIFGEGGSCKIGGNSC